MDYRWLKEENVKPLHEALFEMCEKRPKTVALEYFGKKLSYRELKKLTQQCAAAFIRLVPGVNTGERIAIFMPNIPQFVISYYGAQAAGMVPVPINFSSIVKELRTKKPSDIKITDEIVAQFADAKPKILVVADICWPIAEQLGTKLNRCTIVFAGMKDFLPFPLNILYPIKARKEGKLIPRPEGTYAFKPLLSAECPGCSWVSTANVENISQSIYTGGTTGTPKGAEHTHRNIMTNALQCREHMGDLIKEPVISLGVAPFFHSYGLTACMHMTLLSFGGTVVLLPRFMPKEVLETINKKKVTLFPGVNRMLQTIADMPDGQNVAMPSLSLCVSGAGPLDLSVKRKFEDRTGSLIIEGYGLTETSPVVSVTLPTETKNGSVGRPLPGTEVRIVDVDTGTPLEKNEEGEIIVRGPQVMRGYYNKPAETAAMIKDGWLYTGDIGKKDDEGFIYITDRKKDMYTRNGENIFPAQIDAFFLMSSLVKKCATIGVSDRKLEHMTILLSVLSDGRTEQELKSYAASVPSSTMRPDKIELVTDAQFSEWEDALGKLQRRKAREYYKNLKK